ncbi:hypothetical protein GCM10010359_17390 [Streptomyces morookaense]|nr:hypothetical protein GCM10010359_17390 [Streptomyces morookaense]
MSALSPRRRSVLRAVVTSAALASAVLAPAAAAFADAPAVPGAPVAPAASPAAPAASTAPASPAAKAVEAGTPAVPAEGGPKQDRSARPAEQPKAEGKGDDSRTSEGKDRQPQSHKGDGPVTYTLVDGHRMAVGKDNPHQFRGEVVENGHAVLIMSSSDETDVAYWGGMRVALHPDGTVESSWIVDHPSKPYRKDADPHISDPGRFEGTPVSIAKGLVAVLRRDPNDGGPEAWIREVGPGWKPGDPYIVRVAAVLNRENRTDTVGGLHLSLEGADGPTPVLKVDGKAYPFPKVAEGANGGGSTGTSAARGGAHAQTAGTAALPAADAAAQTKAIPEGGVAAGAEGVREGNDTALVAAIGGFAAVSAAGIAFTVLRRRAVGVRG